MTQTNTSATQGFRIGRRGRGDCRAQLQHDRMSGCSRLAGSALTEHGGHRGLVARFAALCIAAALSLLPTSASALFHIAVIDEVMTGLSGTDDVQFVEIRMLAGSQNIVTGSKLSAFDANGNFLRVVLTVGANVTGGMNRAWIMASTDFAAASGITPDFTFTSSGGLGLEPNDGMVCWGKPSNEMNAGQYVD
jgi:hypothetical protein